MICWRAGRHTTTPNIQITQLLRVSKCFVVEGGCHIQLASSPQPTDTVSEKESHERASDGTYLDHCGDVALDVRVFIVVELIKAEKVLKMNGVESARDQALINSWKNVKFCLGYLEIEHKERMSTYHGRLP